MDKQINVVNLTAYLLPHTYTKNQALKRLRLIKDFLNFVFFESKVKDDFKTNFEAFRKIVSAKDNPEELKELDFIANLDSSFFQVFESTTLHSQIEQLEKQVLNSKLVVLYIPFEMPNSEIERIGSWFKQNLGENTLFEINFDPSLIGGCALSLNGVYKDFSLRARIKENKDSVNKILLGFKGE